MQSLPNNKHDALDINGRLRQAALAYLAKNPASSTRVKSVLQRKLKNWQIADPETYTDYICQTLIPDLQRMTLLDDAAYATGLAVSYTRRGYAPVDAQARAKRLGVKLASINQKQALLYRMKRKNWGPFAPEPMTEEMAQKARIYLQRAGFGMG